MGKYLQIKEIGKVITGKTPSTEDASNFDGKYPFITPSDIKSFDEKYLLETERTLSEKGIKKLKNNILPKEAICFVCIGSTIGKMCLTNTIAYSNQQINSLIVNNNFDAHYMFYFLRYIKSYFQQLGAGTGSGKGIVNKTTFENSKVKVETNKNIQVKIADILSTYDNLIENNNKRIRLLEQMAENLYKEWFVRFRFPGYEDVEFESGIPKGWEILRANQLFDITIGKTPDRKIFEYFSNIPECNYPWISISDMRSASTFVFKTKEYLTINAVNTCNVKIIPKNTVIVSFKLTVGQVAITTSDMCTNEAIAHFTTDNAAMREYIYLYLKNFQYSDLGNTSSIGTAVNSKIIKNMKIILPSSELLNRFHDSVYSIFEKIRLLNETNNNLIKQRDMLLPRLMSGKLEV